MLISAIVACAENNVIGRNNQIPWYLPADLQYFKRTTQHHHIIMGRNCFESIGKPLPNRTNIVVTRDLFFTATGCIVAHSIEEALQTAKKNKETEVFIIGGGIIYAQTLALCDKIYLTAVDLKTEGDVFFPVLNEKEWRLVSEEKHLKDSKNEYDYCFKIFTRLIG
jgi:dihydrofolate reductase